MVARWLLDCICVCEGIGGYQDVFVVARAFIRGY